jgi:hypothetical protein
MDLDDLVDLSSPVINEVQEAIMSSNVDCSCFFCAFFSNGEVNERLAEGFPPSSIIQGDQLPWKVTVLDFKESDVFSATRNQRAGASIIEPNVNQVKVT